MVCVSGKAEIEGVTERVPMMKEKKEKIDFLFEKNAAEQLADVNWQGLNAAISSRLEQAEQSKTSVRKYPNVFKIAAAVAAAAAVVFIAVMVKTEAPTDLQLENGRSAVVKFIESRGFASVEIKRAGIKTQVMVNVGGSGRKVARCDVKIIDLNGDWKEAGNRAAWIIISIPEPVVADNGPSRDEMDLICLL